MPLEDALALVERNYTNYLQDRAVTTKPPSSSALPAAVVHSVPPLPSEPPPPRVQPPLPTAAPPAAPIIQAQTPTLVVPSVELTIPQLINLLADRKQLTIQEMDRVISHLQAVRRKMAVEQGVDPDPLQSALNIQNAQLKPGGYKDTVLSHILLYT